MKFGLKEETIKKIKTVLYRYPEIKTAIIYGSRAKGNHKNGSDIDLTLKGKDLSLTLIHKIENQIDDLLLPYTFDISIYTQIDNPELLEHVNKAGKVFYKRN